MPYVSFEIVQAAIVGLQVKKQSVAAKIAKLREMQRNDASMAGAKDSASTHRPATQRKATTATRERMAKGRRKRGAVSKKAGVSNAARSNVMKPRLSPAGRRRIIAATRKRWAAIRAAKEQSQR